MTRLKTTIVSTSCLAAALFSARPARAAEDATAQLAKAPPAVIVTVKRSLGDHKLAEFGKEMQGEKLVFEAGYAVNGVDHAVLVAPDGAVVQEEADVEVSTLPAAVTDAVKKAHPDGKLDEAATAKAGESSFFALDVKVGKATRVMNIAADGKVISDVLETSVSDEN